MYGLPSKLFFLELEQELSVGIKLSKEVTKHLVDASVMAKARNFDGLERSVSEAIKFSRSMNFKKIAMAIPTTSTLQKGYVTIDTDRVISYLRIKCMTQGHEAKQKFMVYSICTDWFYTKYKENGKYVDPIHLNGSFSFKILHDEEKAIFHPDKTIPVKPVNNTVHVICMLMNVLQE